VRVERRSFGPRADVVTTTGFDDAGPKQLFMQMAIADDEVPNIASEYQARTMNIPLITPSPYTPYGMTVPEVLRARLLELAKGKQPTEPTTSVAARSSPLVRGESRTSCWKRNGNESFPTTGVR
jgi:hypothetical protein